MKTNVFLGNSFCVYLNEGKTSNGTTAEWNHNFFFFRQKGTKLVFIWLSDYPVVEKNVTYSFHLSFEVR